MDIKNWLFFNDAIEVEIRNNAIFELRLWRFTFSVGWYFGEDTTILKIIILRLITFGRSFVIELINFQTARFIFLIYYEE